MASYLESYYGYLSTAANYYNIVILFPTCCIPVSIWVQKQDQALEPLHRTQRNLKCQCYWGCEGK